MRYTQKFEKYSFTSKGYLMRIFKLTGIIYNLLEFYGEIVFWKQDYAYKSNDLKTLA